ncbi:MULTISPECIES: Fe(3+)-hydroxamate ABC transporter permease FhuB [Paenibacillus]|uniref:Fe(3+)-hydroxamate ABC transporter permease FhuB n=2 Tax=Bacillales TaxID=1385 RepID=A0ABW9T4F8_9BACL|nr:MULTISPECIES: Fe(3+)-hydroxamate ABC transporter permease FhuB [Paenibacillus]MUG67967.1 Fe(3+)-hydroxamate ABC transporter permease FhuB [Paenibacillus campinasensis]PAK49647.1 Fe3+-hydroxamate ABC transporter permease FhuB [Paenibacillus sp. 7541]
MSSAQHPAQGAQPPSIHPAPPASTGWRGWKPLWVLVLGLLSLIVLTFVSLTQGLADISVKTVVQALVSPQDIADHHMIRSVRLPRTVMGLLAGAALAVSGVLMQTVTRNPLASETTLGVNAGAYLAVVVGLIFWPGLLHQYALPLAVAGGTLAAVAVYALAGRSSGSPLRIALSGMIVTLVLSSVTSALVLLNQQTTQGIFLWGSGSLIQNDWDGVAFSWPWIVGGLLVLYVAVRQWDILLLNEESARSLGQKVGTARLLAMGAAIVLACVTVSVVGPIGFIGLIAPHLVRLSGVIRHGGLIPLAALWGSALLVGADTVARMFVNAYGELPVGAITAMLGAPCLIWLALRVSRSMIGSPRSSGGSMMMGGSLRRVPYPVLVALFGTLLVIIWILSLMSGSLRIPLSEVVAVLTGGGEAMYRQILLDFRLPRLLTAGLSGMAIAISGSLLQQAVRNPLGDPQVVGVTSGAGAGALLLMVGFPQLSAAWVPVGAVLGGIAASALVYAVSWRRGLHPTILTLVGIAVAALGSAIINLMIIHAKVDVAPALSWMAGSTYNRTWTEVQRIVPTLLILLPIALWLGRRVDLLAFSEESSTGLGLHVRNARLYVAIIAVLLASIAAANVGSVGFIGLLAPHAARMLVGPNHRRSMLIAALLGGILLAAADWIGRVVIIPKELPSGIVTALIGAPYLLFLMSRSSKLKRK